MPKAYPQRGQRAATSKKKKKSKGSKPKQHN